MKAGAPAVRVLGALLVAALLAFAGAGQALTYDPEVEAAQRRLDELGFAPGPVDGLMGRRTRHAIHEFQKARGLPVSGRLDDPTRIALGLVAAPAPAAEPAAPAAPAPPAPAPEARPAAVPPEPRAAPARARGPGWLITYEALGWHPPQSGAEAYRRFQKEGSSGLMEQAGGDLVVGRPEEIYVLDEGERIPRFDCDPSAGDIGFELTLGFGGPVIFRSLDDGGFCQLGFGIVLSVGRTLRMEQAYWGDTEFPAGTVRMGRRGLEWLEP